MRYFFVFVLAFVSLFADKISVEYGGSNDYKIVSKVIKDSSFFIEETNGDIQNIRSLLKEQAVKMAVCQSDILKDLSKMSEKLRNNLKIISPLYDAPVVLIVKKDSGITSFRDLDGRVVVVDIKGSGDYYTFLKLQEKYLINPEVYNIKKGLSYTYLKSGKADALFYIGDANTLSRNFKNYRFISLGENFRTKNFKIDSNTTKRLSYVDKFLVTTTSKAQSIKKSDIGGILNRIIYFNKNNKNNICSYNLDATPVKSLKYLYFQCSTANIESKKETKKALEHTKIIVPKEVDKVYFDSLDDILIFSQALFNHNYNASSTSYYVEKAKFSSAIKLIKKSLANDKNRKVVIISRGDSKDAQKYLLKVYRKLKTNGIERGSIIKRAEVVDCKRDHCFKETTISFKII